MHLCYFTAMDEPAPKYCGDPAREAELRRLAEGLGIGINEVAWFDRALTHASSVAEADAPGKDYEALEFLGDAVLGLAIAHYLFVQVPDRTPGEYSRMRAAMVNRQSVARVAQSLGLAPLIQLGRGEEACGGRRRTALMADCLEAFIGAIYLDGGWQPAGDFVNRVFFDEFERARAADRVWDYKSRLQHHCQAEHLGLPRFEVVRSEGPDHRKEFEVEVFVQEVPAGRGRGLSKKEAEQNAAREALERAGIMPR